jgi:hypothetical protein
MLHSTTTYGDPESTYLSTKHDTIIMILMIVTYIMMMNGYHVQK